MATLKNFFFSIGWFWFSFCTVKTDNCEWNEVSGVTYDLSPLELSSHGQLPYYTVKDARYADNKSTTDEFEYSFNICAKVIKRPKQCNGTYTWCEEANGTCSQQPLTGIGYAYQTRGGSRCHPLSNGQSKYTKFELLDADEPAKGVVLIYTNGEWCDEHKVNREFRLRFQCENDYYNIPDEEIVTEVNCTYNVTVKSINGCPTQCGVYSNSLCGSNGICSYDWTNDQAGCFCFWNRGGKACEEETGSIQYVHIYPERHNNYTHTFPTMVNWKDHNGVSKTSQVNVTYDYTPFFLSEGAYQVNDTIKPFLYRWNFLGTVPSSLLSTNCSFASSPCSTPGDCSNIPANGDTPGAAFQINKANGKCNLLARGKDYRWNLYDPQDPARGVAFTYLDGGYCESEQSNREFTINFVCPTTNKKYSAPVTNLEIDTYVEESDAHQCKYNLTLETALACPYQCLRHNGNSYSVCSGRGVCVADPIARAVRCLCDAGYEGYWCEEVAQSSTSSATSRTDSHVGLQVAISIVTILVIVFVAVSLYLYIRNRSLEKFRGQLLDEEADDVTSPPLHTEPKVPDDMSDTDSEPEDNENNETKNKTNKSAATEKTAKPDTELVTVEQKKTGGDNFEIKLEGPPTEK